MTESEAVKQARRELGRRATIYRHGRDYDEAIYRLGLAAERKADAWAVLDRSAAQRAAELRDVDTFDAIYARHLEAVRTAREAHAEVKRLRAEAPL